MDAQGDQYDMHLPVTVTRGQMVEWMLGVPGGIECTGMTDEDYTQWRDEGLLKQATAVPDVRGAGT